jgi:ribose 5-phosphate isomerase B
MIGIASDHGGYKLKEEIIKKLQEENKEVVNYGTNNSDSVDYPDYASLLCSKITDKEVEKGIVICSTGIGVSMVCNKIKGIRCAKVDNEDEAYFTRFHNDANVIALNGSTDIEKAYNLVKVFLETEFSDDERHVRRIKKMMENEND